MYNVASFIAIVQQAIKKPLVTELLPRSSYIRGWRCEYNYVQLLYIGQVILINYSIAHIKKHGDRRWFLSKPIKIYNYIQQLRRYIHVECLRFPKIGKQNGWQRAFWLGVTEMKKARYWQYLAFNNFSILSTAYIR